MVLNRGSQCSFSCLWSSHWSGHQVDKLSHFSLILKVCHLFHEKNGVTLPLVSGSYGWYGLHFMTLIGENHSALFCIRLAVFNTPDSQLCSCAWFMCVCEMFGTVRSVSSQKWIHLYSPLAPDVSQLMERIPKQRSSECPRAFNERCSPVCHWWWQWRCGSGATCPE